MEQWYALQSKPYKEIQVRESLASRGIEVYLPALVRTRRRSGGIVEKPYFPSYLFVHADLKVVGVSAVRYTPGLLRIVAFQDQEPTAVQDQVIELIRRRLAAMETFDPQGEPLEPGDRVIIQSGPFKDYEALFDRTLSPQGRVRLLIHLLSRPVPLETTIDAIRKVR